MRWITSSNRSVMPSSCGPPTKAQRWFGLQDGKQEGGRCQGRSAQTLSSRPNTKMGATRVDPDPVYRRREEYRKAIPKTGLP